MVTIEIAEDTFAQLKANADARQLAVDDYLQKILSADATNSARQLAALQSFAKEMAEWSQANLPAGHIVDDSRDSMYPDRD